MFERFIPRIIIRKTNDDQYKWFLFLSPNKDRPSCVSPVTYSQPFKCRESAREFAMKLKGPLKILDKVAREEETVDNNVIIVDETKAKNANITYTTDTI